jgi:hypothetical protein
MQIYRNGDLVNVKFCEELKMPCRVEGFDPWMRSLTKEDGSTMMLYKVIGTHRNRGNEVSVRVVDSQLSLWQGEPCST